MHHLWGADRFHEYFADQSVSPTPVPLPDTSKLPKFLYLPVKDTPTLDKEGIQKEADDFHPKARLKALHKEKAIHTYIIFQVLPAGLFSNLFTTNTRFGG